MSNCEIFVTDTRGMRGVADVTHPDYPAVSMLGAAQLAWLKNAMVASRRQFLRGVGVALSLPLLDAMTPAFARDAAKAPPPRRLFGICNNLGLLPENFFPAADAVGRGYALSPYLDLLSAHRDDFTVFTGVSHPDVDGGHPADNCFLTAAPHPGSGGFRNTISLDQFIAERQGNLTRFPSLTLGVNVQQGSRSLSWTGGGVLIPCSEKPSDVSSDSSCAAHRSRWKRRCAASLSAKVSWMP